MRSVISLYTWSYGVRVVQVVSSGLAPYKLPRALGSLLIYQQPSSTTLYYSYLGILTLIEVRLSNEAWEITCVNALARVAHLASSGSSMMLNTSNHKRRLRCNNALLCLASLTSISWTGWRRTTYHWQLLSSCYINSLRQPYRPTLTHYPSFTALKGVFRPSSASVIS